MKALAVCVVVACTEAPGFHEPAFSDESYVELVVYEVPPAGRADIVIVLDTSPAMAPHLPRIEQALVNLGDVLSRARLDLHLAVVSPGEPFDDFLVEVPLTDGSVLRNYEGALGDALVARATPHAAGPAAPSLLDTLHRTLEHDRFRRADSHLGIAVIAATDDASSGTIARHVDALRSGRVQLTTVIPTIDCGEAAPRLAAFASAFRSYAYPICMSETIATPIPGTLDWRSPNVCAESPLVDVDEAPGLQPWCEGEIQIGDSIQELPRCNGAIAPCWQLDQQDFDRCPDRGIAFDTRLPLLGYRERALVTIQCVVEPR